jgi:predicted PurR-regulated permease PerM
MKNILFVTKSISGGVKQFEKLITLKKILLQHKIAVFLFIAVLCACIYYVINKQAVTEVENLIAIIKYYFINRLQDTNNEILSLQEVIALHSYAIASSSCFLLGFYFISTSRKFN